MFHDCEKKGEKGYSNFCLKLKINELKDLVRDITNLYLSLDFDSKDNEFKYNKKIRVTEDILGELKCKQKKQ